MSTKTKQYFHATLAAAVAVTGAAAIAPTNTEASTSFSDVKQADYFYEAVANLAERGIIKGFEDGTFLPNKAVTRGQVAKILAGALSLDTTNVKDPGFKDIPKTHQYYGAIAALANAGIITGFEDGTFRQGEPVLRNHMAKMIAKGFNLQADGTAPFTDVRADYADYITALYTNGVTTGKTATTFDGASNVTRGQLATFVVRAEKPVQAAQQEVTVTIDDVTNAGIQTAQGTFKAAAAVATLFVEGNKAALKNAQLIATVEGNQIVAVKQLTLQETSTKTARLVFDGGKVAVDTIVVKSAFTELKNITVNNSVVIEKVAVQPVASRTAIAAEVENTIVALEQVTAPSVEVKRSGLALHSTTKLAAVVVAADVASFALHASVGVLTVDGTTKVTVANEAKVEQLIIPQDAKLQDIITNYDRIQANIGRIVDAGGQSVQAVTSGGGGRGNSNKAPEEKQPAPETEEKGPEANPNEPGTEHTIGAVDGKQINAAGTYGPASGKEVIEGNLIVNVADVTLQNIEVTGKLILADGIKEGNVYLNNVTVAGETVVNGGGTNSIYFKDSMLATVIVNKESGSVRIVAEGKTKVVEVQLETPTIVVEKALAEGATGFEDIIVTEAMAAAGTAAKVELQGVFDTINSRAANVRISVGEASDIKALILNAMADVFGAGVIQMARVNGGSVTFEQRPQTLIVDTAGYVSVAGEQITESYSVPGTEAIVQGITAAQGVIDVEMDRFVAGLTADDFDVVALLVDEQTTADSTTVESANIATADSADVATADTVELQGLRYDAAKQRFTFTPLSVGQYAGKKIEVRVTPKHEQLSKETVISAYTVTTGFGGRITDVLGVGIANLTIRFREGAGATAGHVVQTAVTDDYGYYTVNVPAGVYTGEFSSAGYVTTYMVGTALSDTFLTDQDETAVRAAASQEVKIMLTWNEHPADLDSHLQGPAASGEEFHIYYMKKNYEDNNMVYADLDLDDVTSYGPETTTIRKLVNGEYRFFVHHFSGMQTLRTSGAKVAVFLGNASTPAEIFDVPAGEGNELYWDVFDLVVTENGQKVTIRPVNVLTKNRQVLKDRILEGYYWKIEVFEDATQAEKTKAVQARVDELELPESAHAVVSYDEATASYVVTYEENETTKKVTLDVDFKIVTVASLIQEAFYHAGSIHISPLATFEDRVADVQRILANTSLPEGVQVTPVYKVEQKQWFATYEVNGIANTVKISPEFSIQGVTEAISASTSRIELPAGTTEEQKVALVQQTIDKLQMPDGFIPVVYAEENYGVYRVEFNLGGYIEKMYVYPNFYQVNVAGLIGNVNYSPIQSSIQDSAEARAASVQQMIDEMDLPQGTNAQVLVDELGDYAVAYTVSNERYTMTIFPQFVMKNEVFTSHDTVYITTSNYVGYGDIEFLQFVTGTAADVLVSAPASMTFTNSSVPAGVIITVEQEQTNDIDLSAVQSVFVQTKNAQGETSLISVEIAQ